MRIKRLAACLGLITGLLAPTAWASDGAGGLTAFGSMAELNAFLAAIDPQDPPAAVCPPNKPDCDQELLEEIVITGSRIPSRAKAAAGEFMRGSGRE